MATRKTPQVTRHELMTLFDQLGTWIAVAKHLGISISKINALKSKFDVSGRMPEKYKKRRSSLLPYLEDIRQLAEQNYTCPEIVRELGLDVQDEQVRRFMKKHNIKRQNRGAQPGEKHRDWKGGRITDKDGYILILKPDHPHANSNGYIREHRLVMEEHLGRHLRPEEVVHHINQNPADNRIENLEVYDSNNKHLKITLKGKIPKWTKEGRERILKAVRKPRKPNIKPSTDE